MIVFCKKVKLFIGLLIVLLPLSANADTTCTGATYYDSDSDTCIACPDGFDYNTDNGKTSISDCQTYCAAGTYFTANPYVFLDYISTTSKQNIDTNYGPTSNNLSGKIIIKPTQSMTHVDFFEVPSTMAIGYEKGAFFIWIKGVSANLTYTTTLDVNQEYDIRFEITGTTRTLTVNGTTVSDTVNVNIRWSNDKKLKLSGGNWPILGDIYTFQFNDNGVEVFDFIPVQESTSNGDVGMFNRVDGNFYTNSGSGNFVAGTVAQNQTMGQCVNVGYNYYAAASTVNYGSAGLGRTACPSGHFTATETSASVNDCIQCTGANYQDTATHQCVPCPIGYDYNTDSGKMNISDCQMHCDAGTYFNPFTILEYIESTSALKQYIETNYVPTSNNLMGHIVVSPTTNVSHVDFIGSSNLSVGYNNSKDFFIWSKNPGELTYTAPFVVETTYTIDFEVTTNGRSVTVNGVTVSDNNGGVSTGSLKLFRNEPTTNFVGRIYEMQLYDDGNLVFDLIPVQRNADGVIGMLNRVNNVFWVNAGAGEFVSGPAIDGQVISDTGQCVKVGYNYYSSANTVNYGSNIIGRTACPSGLFTATETSTSIDDCVSCTGATYQDTNTHTCVSCPNGYDYNTQAGKNDVSQCQISCGPGTYLSVAETVTCTDVGPGYWAASDAVNYGSVGARNACPAGLTTVGYGHGADEIYDCGRVLNIGDKILYTRQNKLTTPSLNVMFDNGDLFYISASPTNHNISRLHASWPENQYTLYDDSLLYEERNFDTGLKQNAQNE